MSEVRNRETGQVMYESELRQSLKDKAQPSFAQLTAEIANLLGYDIVFEGPQATGGTVYQYSQRSGVEQQSDGKWYTKYILGPVFTDRAAEGDRPAQTAAEQETAYKAMKDAEQAKSVRESRRTKLAECDWTQLADSPADDMAWAVYRQALRDITLQAGFPWTITWPEQL